MINFTSSISSLSSQQSTPEWLEPNKKAGLAKWEDIAWPNRKAEHWKHTSLKSLAQQTFQLPNAVSDSVSLDLVEIPNLESSRLVFVDGVFSKALSSPELPSQIVFFDETTEEQKTIVQNYLGKIVEGDKHLFAILSNAALAGGVLVHLKKNETLSQPIQIVYVNSGNGDATFTNSRVLVVLEDNSNATVIEQFVSAAPISNSFENALLEAHLSAGSKLTHYRLNTEDENVTHMGGVHVNLYRHSTFSGYALAQGSKLKRLDYHIKHLGEGAHLELQGIYIPKNKQHVDIHSEVEHRVPNCTSNEVFRGIMADKSKAVFNGRIHIHPDAQKTLAQLSNKNLLLSNEAEINTKPELEIYADDVRCAHGATVSQINEKELFYMLSRGVSRSEAQVMLSFGFINEILQEFPNEAIRDYLRPKLATIFGRDDSLSEHLIHE